MLKISSACKIHPFQHFNIPKIGENSNVENIFDVKNTSFPYSGKLTVVIPFKKPIKI